MEKYCFVFKQDLKNGIAYIWYNATQENIKYYLTRIISCPETEDRKESEKNLLELVKEEYPDASVWQDGRDLHYIKTSS